jgi:hypothetical protein
MKGGKKSISNAKDTGSDPPAQARSAWLHTRARLPNQVPISVNRLMATSTKRKSGHGN